MQIENKVKDTKVFTLDQFLSLEFNNLKDNNKRDISKLKKSIIKNGFVFPVYTWAGNNFCIDGKGRELAIKELVKEGYSFNEIPYVEIVAKDMAEAKQRVLEASSQHGDITRQSFIEFADFEVDFETIEIKGIDSDLDSASNEDLNEEIGLDSLNGDRTFKINFEEDESYFTFLEKLNEVKEKMGITNDRDLFIKLLNEI